MEQRVNVDCLKSTIHIPRSLFFLYIPTLSLRKSTLERFTKEMSFFSNEKVLAGAHVT